MRLSEEQRALLWLSSAEISALRVQRLKETYGSAAALWQAFGTPEGPAFQPRAKASLERLHHEDEMAALMERLENAHVHLLFETDAAYPDWLRTIDDFPYLLYYAGRLECLNAPAVGVVGSRKASEYGLHIARAMGRELAKAGVTVVSGLARGIDGAAHQGALEGEGATVGVLGSGINNPYPPEHTPLLRKIAGGKGLILSEYPLDAEPSAFHFPYRNRIISGLSLGVVFVEGAIKSGGMHTVTAALTQGREVFAVPGLVGSQGAEGPHAILREGARIATSAGDVLDDLGLRPLQPKARKAANEPKDPDERRVYQCLLLQPMTVDQLADKLGMDVGEVMTHLSVMEINGLVAREAGNLFLAPVSPQD